jgi:hypothetical protein
MSQVREGESPMREAPIRGFDSLPQNRVEANIESIKRAYAARQADNEEMRRAVARMFDQPYPTPQKPRLRLVWENPRNAGA